MKKRGVALGALLGSAALVILSSAPATALSSAESRFVSLLNKERASRGLDRLVVSGRLSDAARAHSRDMARKGTIWHGDLVASTVGGIFVMAENVGMAGSVTDAHRAFMASKGHRANILNPDPNRIGVGVAFADGTLFVTESFGEAAAAAAAPPPARSTASTSSSSTTVQPRGVRSIERLPDSGRAAASQRRRPPAVPLRTLAGLTVMVELDTDPIGRAGPQTPAGVLGRLARAPLSIPPVSVPGSLEIASVMAAVALGLAKRGSRGLRSPYHAEWPTRARVRATRNAASLEAPGGSALSRWFARATQRSPPGAVIGAMRDRLVDAFRGAVSRSRTGRHRRARPTRGLLPFWAGKSCVRR